MNTKSAVATLISNLSTANKSAKLAVQSTNSLEEAWKVASTTDQVAIMYVLLAYAPGNYYENKRRWNGRLAREFPSKLVKSLGYTL